MNDDALKLSTESRRGCQLAFANPAKLCAGACQLTKTGPKRLGHLLLMLLGLSQVQAQEIYRTGIVDYPDGTPGLGGAVYIGTDNYLGEKTDHDQLPLFLYEGKRVFADGNSLGFKFVSSDSFSFGVLARARGQSVDTSEISDLTGITARKSTLEAGLTTMLATPVGEIQLTAVKDVLGRYDGREVDLTYRLPLRMERWTLTPWVSRIWQDASLTAYYYGVTESEAGVDYFAYSPGDARHWVYGLNTSFRLNDRALLFANVGLEILDPVIAASPIVESSSNVRAVVGAAWIFGGETPSRPDGTSDDGSPLWSWRLHWAYQLHHNIFPLGLSGIATPSRLTPETVPTQFGVTVSRILKTSERADLFARFSVFRHFEEPFQENFYSYNFSMTTMMKSYANFSDDVALRWGLGFGMSYVESIPGQEVQKLVNYSVDYSRLLAYIEAQVDFPLDRIIKSKHLKGCFIGLMITHRSGVFGGSTTFGGVRGGSDWGGIHLECLQ